MHQRRSTRPEFDEDEEDDPRFQESGGPRPPLAADHFSRNRQRRLARQQQSTLFPPQAPVQYSAVPQQQYPTNPQQQSSFTATPQQYEYATVSDYNYAANPQQQYPTNPQYTNAANPQQQYSTNPQYTSAANPQQQDSYTATLQPQPYPPGAAVYPAGGAAPGFPAGYGSQDLSGLAAAPGYYQDPSLSSALDALSKKYKKKGNESEEEHRCRIWMRKMTEEEEVMKKAQTFRDGERAEGIWTQEQESRYQKRRAKYNAQYPKDRAILQQLEYQKNWQTSSHWEAWQPPTSSNNSSSRPPASNNPPRRPPASSNNPPSRSSATRPPSSGRQTRQSSPQRDSSIPSFDSLADEMRFANHDYVYIDEDGRRHDLNSPSPLSRGPSPYR